MADIMHTTGTAWLQMLTAQRIRELEVLRRVENEYKEQLAGRWGGSRAGGSAWGACSA
jgi:hypothetical protein